MKVYKLSEHSVASLATFEEYVAKVLFYTLLVSPWDPSYKYLLNNNYIEAKESIKKYEFPYDKFTGTII